jgi:hypothetical protein
MFPDKRRACPWIPSHRQNMNEMITVFSSLWILLKPFTDKFLNGYFDCRKNIKNFC